MSASADHGGRDVAKGETQTNTSKVRRSASKDVASSNASNIGKAKRKLPITVARSARTSRESSPVRSYGSKAPHYQVQQQSSANAPASQPDSLQPRPLQALPNSTRLTISRTPPSDTRLLASSPRKKSEPSAPPSSTHTTLARQDGSERSDDPGDTDGITSAMKTPRSNSSTALETVAEGTSPATPTIGSSLEESVAALVQRQNATAFSVPGNIPEEIDTDSTSTITRKGRADSVSSSIAPSSTAESESESGYRSEDKTPTSSLHRVPPPARVFGRRPTVTGKDTSSKAMTVETETVSSVPQVGLGAVGAGGGASIRSKKSTDTIRAPRKEKKRTTRRTVAAGPSNPSSKADIFAAKIAEAVDEANSSDSEETTARKGMKFVNNSLNKEASFGGDGVSGDGMGSERGHPGSSRERHGRGDKNGGRSHNTHRSILTDDGPFNRSLHKPSTSSLRNAATSFMSSRQSSQPPSPKHTALRNGPNMNGGKRSLRTHRVYEADVENGDDEHTPLVPASRPRRKGRSLNSSIRQMEHNARRRGIVKTYAGCIVAVFAILLILTGVGGFLVATTNALQGVRVLNVTDVLVSKQEIMLDLVVEGINPNAIAVTIGSMDVNIFAKSSHVRDGDGEDGVETERKHGSDWWDTGKESPRGPGDSRESYLGRATIEMPKRLYPPSFSRPRYDHRGNVDEGTDPPDDLPNDKETMLLGRIFSFDSVLTFEGSPLRHIPSVSTGELRLAKPGNKTEEGGSARWERVLLHPFELIVRGVLKYQLPLSGRIRTAPISGSVMIHPELSNTID
ncbi:vacuolar segregation subunit 7-domain-containing protein [Sphaerosporella brunnea]|uniref:Vacuolar segregation subunit 7-domain-containing protein n=1 Tax=Sphaerosporella brunnea TaxID=1250544 RepID=A0A5J5EGF9_9PEZI|nr:vacuolar segregation subunit 7-domain-containing protein [Sphaerosporella brunnea]